MLFTFHTHPEQPVACGLTRPAIGYAVPLGRDETDGCNHSLTTLACWFCHDNVMHGMRGSVSRVDGDSKHGYEPVHQACIAASRAIVEEENRLDDERYHADLEALGCAGASINGD